MFLLRRALLRLALVRRNALLDLRRWNGQDAPNQRIEPLKLRGCCRLSFHADMIAQHERTGIHDNFRTPIDIVEMFKNQTLLYAGLVELLKSRDVVGPGDLHAFDELVSASLREFLEQNVEERFIEETQQP